MTEPRDTQKDEPTEGSPNVDPEVLQDLDADDDLADNIKGGCERRTRPTT